MQANILGVVACGFRRGLPGGVTRRLMRVNLYCCDIISLL